MTIVNIDAAWLAAHAPPYQLSVAGATYLLMQDIVTPGTAFVVGASNVTLDLNGHVVTYDDAPPLVVPNAGFEAGDFTGWDVSGMPHASIASPVIPGFWGDYFASFSAPASPTPTTEVMTSGPVVLPTMGIPHEADVTLKGYVGFASVVLSVLDSASGTTIASSTLNVNTIAGGMLFAAFTPTAANCPSGSVRLKLSALPKPNLASRLDIDYANVSRSLVGGITFTFNKTNFRLTSSSTEGSGVELGPVAISGGKVTGVPIGATGSGYATPPTVLITNGQGLAGGLGARAHAVLAADKVAEIVIDDGGSGYTDARAYVLSGGRIVQGRGRSVRSSAVLQLAGIDGLTVDGLGLMVTGRDCCCIQSNYARRPVVKGCTCYAGLDQISNRMAALAVVGLYQSYVSMEATGNTVAGTHQNGILLMGNTGYPTAVLNDNTVAQNSSWTDGYSVGINRVDGFEVARNTCTPISGRGMILQTNLGNDMRNGEIHHNAFTVRERQNLEYDTNLNACAFRIRNYDGRLENVDIHDNLFAAYTGEFVGSDRWACGAKFSFNQHYGTTTGELNNCGVKIRNNTFKGIIADKANLPADPRAYGITMAVTDPGTGIIFDGNTCESNHICVNFGDVDGVGEADYTFTGTTFVKSAEGDQSLPFRAFNLGYYTGPPAEIRDIRIIDEAYQGGATRSMLFEGAAAKEITFGATLTVEVVDGSGVPQAGAGVTVKDAAGATLFAGTTDAVGTVRAPIPLSRYAVPANSKGVPAITATPQPLEITVGGGSASLTMDGPKALTIATGGGPASVEGACLLDGSGDLAAEGIVSWPAAEDAAILDGSADLAAEGRARWRFVVYDPVPF